MKRRKKRERKKKKEGNVFVFKWQMEIILFFYGTKKTNKQKIKKNMTAVDNKKARKRNYKLFCFKLTVPDYVIYW